MFLAAGACSDNTVATGPRTLRPSNAPRHWEGQLAPVWVCKEGPDGTFDFSYTDGTTSGTTTLTVDNSTQDGAQPCNEIWVGTQMGFDPVTVTELPHPGTSLIDVEVTNDLGTPISFTNAPNGVIVTPTLGVATVVHFVNATVGTIGDFVWHDLNANGIQDAGEPGIAGQSVTLSENGAPIATMPTDAQGGYLFTNLDAGCYVVTVGTPTDMTPSPSGAGADRAIDSNGSPAPVCIATGEVNRTIDFGFVTPGVCLDPAATNYGGPLPCTYPTTPCPAGSFSFSVLPNGDLSITYDQFPAPNDNSYGVNAVGWPNGHKFSDLVGSDHAGFQLIDGTGTVRLSFNVDYLSANTGAPSGYSSLGVTGGDGKMLVGTASGISATTSLDRNLNGINLPGLFNAAHVQQYGSVNVLLNSPPTDAAHQTYSISDPTLTGWDFHDTYFVTISAAKLAEIGFDPATWQVQPNASQLHNSPAKPCPPTGGGLSITKYEVKDKQVKITIANTTTANVYLTALDLTWPAATNGKLMQVKLDGDVVYDNPDIAGGFASLTTAQLVADQNKRKIDHGSSDVYTLVFEKNADSNLANYAGTVTFSGTTLTVLPH